MRDRGGMIEASGGLSVLLLFRHSSLHTQRFDRCDTSLLIYSHTHILILILQHSSSLPKGRCLMLTRWMKVDMFHNHFKVKGRLGVQIPVELATTSIQQVLHSELKKHIDTINRLATLALPEKVPPPPPC